MKLRALLFATVAALATPALAQAPSPVGQFTDWGAYVVQGGGGKTCYVISTPKQMEPSTLRHGDIYFTVSNRPAENVQGEVMFLAGYSFQDGSPVILDIDGRQFRMFTRNDSAWVEDLNEQSQVVAAMRAGRSMTVSATSGRGNPTRYAFSLSGVTASLNKITEECR